ncbi:hypothetical protein ACH0B5_00510 [Ureibacillus sp. 179-F W5.1 NHS]|uniref:hypothetical protein n=1 Tax=Ureibacillus sp. 179-F W5.1 NHS TaxID=3374297 RepID=UPI003879888B
MRIKHALNDIQSMSHDGGKILTSLQNNYLPLIDLVVRESIQNSLDATIEGQSRTLVDFKIDKFNSEELASNFEEVEHILLKRFPGQQEFIAISDRNTYGLTGDYTSTDFKVLNRSNFYKLVFGIGKNQDKDGAGGSWGYGKTSYFRLGVGIVIYYTRIQTGDGYEERLIASIIEDPSKSERLLSNNERGIAWWGEFAVDGDRIYPITNSEEIGKFLSIFGLSNYQGSETGTTIIIPYLDDFNHESVEEDMLKFPWEKTREDSIRMAVQRWYFPRIWNENYSKQLSNSILDCRVNDVAIHPVINFEPVFKIYQELYSSALLGKPLTANTRVEAIRFGQNGLENQKEPIGHIAFREVSREELKMVPPENKPSGLAYLGLRDRNKIENHTSKVIAYGRKPGMIVEYSVDGPWSNGEVALKEGNILLGFFVPNSYGILADSFKKYGYTTIESYLRSIESSDHAEWQDAVNITLVTRMKNYTSRAIKNAYQNTEDVANSSVTSSLSRKFGALLMPPNNFGKTSARQKLPEKTGEKGTSRLRGSDITVIRSIPINEHSVEVVFKAFVKKETKNNLIIQVLTQDQKMDKESWYKVMGENIQYPFEIETVYINKIDNETIDNSCEKYQDSTVSIQLLEENTTVLEIQSYISNNIEIEGKLKLKVHSNQYVPNVAIRSL